jgi:hypothetical protein
MEKLIYLLWAGNDGDAALNKALLGPVKDQLMALAADRLQINVFDETVQPGAGLRQYSMRPGPSALVAFWVNSSHIRGAFEAVLEAVAPRIAGYAVTESTVLPITERQTDGKRTKGFSQLALIQKPPRVTYDYFFDTWQGSHTAVGVETQSNFYYCQNIVKFGSPQFFCIVEECVPIEAMTDPHAFYEATDAKMFGERLDRMMNSCDRFIDRDKIEVLVTSEFRFGGWTDNADQPFYKSARGRV